MNGNGGGNILMSLLPYLMGGGQGGGQGDPMMALLSIILGGGMPPIGRATGGPVWPGQTFNVGENGPEQLRLGPGSVGNVTPYQPGSFNPGNLGAGFGGPSTVPVGIPEQNSPMPLRGSPGFPSYPGGTGRPALPPYSGPTGGWGSPGTPDVYLPGMPSPIFNIPGYGGRHGFPPNNPIPGKYYTPFPGGGTRTPLSPYLGGGNVRRGSPTIRQRPVRRSIPEQRSPMPLRPSPSSPTRTPIIGSGGFPNIPQGPYGQVPDWGSLLNYL